MPTNASYLTPKGRVSYPNVFKKTSYGNSEPYYDLTLIFPPDTDLSAMQKIAEACALDRWGKLPPKLILPIQDCSERAETAGYDQGGVFIHFKNSKHAPGVMAPNMTPITENEGGFYAGCYARCSFKPFAWEYEGKRGVSFSLCNVQKMADGEPFGAGITDPYDEFEALPEEADSFLQ